MEKICGIYCIKNKINGKCYVGQSVDINNRWKEHKKLHSNNSTYLYNSLKKYSSDGFDWVVLEECSKEQLNSREIHWIEKLDCISPNGYNLKSGGGKNCYYSEETKKKMSESQRGERNHRWGLRYTEEEKREMSESSSGENAYWYGKNRSEETKKKISEKQKRDDNPRRGVPKSEDCRKKISIANSGERNGMFGKHHSEERNKMMSELLSGEKSPLFGVTHSIERKIKSARISMNGRAVCCSNGCIYYSMYEAGMHTNLNKNSISNVCRGKVNKLHGLKFWYVNLIEGCK